MTAVTALATGVIPLEPGRTRYTLSSGKFADMRKGKGRDLRQAARLVDEQTPIAGQFALIAVKIRLDGKDLAFEDVDDLDDDDVAELVQIVMGQRKSDDEIAAAKALAEAQKSDAPKGDGNNEQAPASGSTSGS